MAVSVLLLLYCTLRSVHNIYVYTYPSTTTIVTYYYYHYTCVVWRAGKYSVRQENVVVAATAAVVGTYHAGRWSKSYRRPVKSLTADKRVRHA